MYFEGFLKKRQKNKKQSFLIRLLNGDFLKLFKVLFDIFLCLKKIENGLNFQYCCKRTNNDECIDLFQIFIIHFFLIGVFIISKAHAQDSRGVGYAYDGVDRLLGNDGVYHRVCHRSGIE